jgi:hypothetical protein
LDLRLISFEKRNDQSSIGDNQVIRARPSARPTARLKILQSRFLCQRFFPQKKGHLLNFRNRKMNFAEQVSFGNPVGLAINTKTGDCGGEELRSAA